LIYTAFWSIWIGWVWAVAIGCGWVLGTCWCFWVFWMGTYGIFQLIFFMDYASFWAEKAAAVAGGAAGGDDDA